MKFTRKEATWLRRWGWVSQPMAGVLKWKDPKGFVEGWVSSSTAYDLQMKRSGVRKS